MTSTQRTVARVAAGAALAGLAVGAVVATWELMSAEWVREFQAGPRSPFSERALAIAQRSAFECLGFGALGLLCACLGTLLASFGGARTGRRIAAGFLTAATAVGIWTWSTWITDAALPFLGTGGILAMNVAGYVLVLLGLWIWSALTARIPWAPRDEPSAVVVGAMAAVVGSVAVAVELLYEGRGYASAGQWAIVIAVGIAALPAGALVARLLRPPVAAVSNALARGPLLPRAVTRLGGALGLVCIAVGAITQEFSTVPSEPSYDELRAPGAPAGPNVVLVTIDTLRADHLGCYGYERDTSPFIDSLAEGGVRFADPAAPAAWTKPSTGTILTGLFPSRHGALYHGSLLNVPEGERTLAEAFRDAGYATAGFVSNPNVKRIFAFDRGFDEFFDSPVEDTITLAAIRESLVGAIVMRLSRHQFNWKYENDIFQVNRHVLPWLRANKDQPFFLYVHYIDPHIPYTPPPPYEEQFARDHEGFPLFNERKRLVGIDRYDGEIRYTDDGMRQLVDELQVLGIRDKTLISITSDHGEEFFEHEILGHGFSLYQPVIRVPLIMNGPGVTPGRVVTSPVQLVDLPATLLDLARTGVDRLGDGTTFAPAIDDAGWKSEVEYFLENEYGQSEEAQRSFVLSGVRMGRWKLILTERNAYRPPWRGYSPQELYDLEADPGEEQNLIDEEEHRELVESLLDRLRAHSKFLDDTGFRDFEPAALSPDVEAELRALGYL